MPEIIPFETSQVDTTITPFLRFANENLNKIYFSRYVIRVPYRVQAILFVISAVHWLLRVRFPSKFYSVYEAVEWILFTIGWIIPQIVLLSIALVKNTENKAMNSHKSYFLKLSLSWLHRASCISLASALSVLLMDKSRFGVCHRETILEHTVCQSHESVLAIPADHVLIVIVAPIFMQLILNTERYTTLFIWCIALTSVAVATAVTSSYHGYTLIAITIFTIFILIENERVKMNKFLVEYMQRSQLLKSTYVDMEAFDLGIDQISFQLHPYPTIETMTKFRVLQAQETRTTTVNHQHRAIAPILNLDEEEVVVNMDHVYDLEEGGGRFGFGGKHFTSSFNSDKHQAAIAMRKNITYDILFGYIQLKPHLYRSIKGFLDANVSTGSSLLNGCLPDDQISESHLSISSLTDSLNRYKKYSHHHQQRSLSHRKALKRQGDEEGEIESLPALSDDVSEDLAYEKIFQQLEELKRKLLEAKILPQPVQPHQQQQQQQQQLVRDDYSCDAASSITSANTAIKLQDPIYHHATDYIDPELGQVNEAPAFVQAIEPQVTAVQTHPRRYHLVNSIPVEQTEPWLKKLLQGQAFSMETILELYDRVTQDKQVLRSVECHDLVHLLQEEIIHVSWSLCEL
jgi:hypothetical protein